MERKKVVVVVVVVVVVGGWGHGSHKTKLGNRVKGKLRFHSPQSSPT
jgi:hypothetical protein